MFHNSGKEPVLFTLGSASENSPEDWVVVEEPIPVPVERQFGYGSGWSVTYRLAPGHAIDEWSPRVRLGASTKAGQGEHAAIQAKPGTTCRARWSLRVLETMRSENGKQVAEAGVSHGTLTTGEVRFRIVEKDARYPAGQAQAGPTGTGEDAAAEKPALPANQDWPEVERILYTDMSGKECGIDLDTGKLYALPKEYNRVVYPRDEIVRWAKDHHIDLFYPANPSYRAPHLRRAGQRAFDNTTWEKVTREDIRDFFTRLGAGKMETPDTMTSLWADNATGAAPSCVYAFVTNEGSRGIVQIVGTVGPYENGTPSGVKIRYRIDRPVGAVDDPAISFDESKIKAANAQLSAFVRQIACYQLDLGLLPNTKQGLGSLRIAPSDLPDESKWCGPYAENDIPLDPWGHHYIYELLTPTQFKIYSTGPDGEACTADDVVGSQ